MKCTLATLGTIVTATVCLAQNRPEPAATPLVDTPPALTEVPKAAVNRSRRPGSPPAALPAPVAAGAFVTLSSKSSRGDTIPPVIIRFSESDLRANAELEQDLYVMARVLSRMLERADGDHVEWKMKVPMLLTGAGKSVRAMYIEGTGPLFMVKVNFPVMPPLKAAPAPAANQPVDSEWDEAQRDLYGPGAMDLLADEAMVVTGYKEEQVELLKREIMLALKNATNIRGLKPEEFLNVIVFGQATASRGRGSSSRESSEAAKGTVMSLRVRKGDIDAFAGGKVDFDGFASKVKTAAYIGSGAGMTSINSWLQDASRTWPVR